MNTTICAVATAQGGAIGMVRVSGSQAIAATDRIFRGRRPLLESKSHTLHFGNIVDGEKIIDEVLVSVFRKNMSYTGEESVEISAHGSPYILQSICSLLLRNGCVLAAPGEFTQRAFLNGRMDLTQAEAVADLIASTNEASHRVAMTQMRGGISRKLRMLRDQLLEMTSLLELELDFSEEDVEFADRNKILSLAHQIRDEITRLSSSFSEGNAIKNGIPVAIIGAPNVGKSTLLNALLREERAIVSEIQGTTRDTIEDTFVINGYLFRFIDTAGIRATDDKIEKIGIERSLKAAENAQIIIMMREPGVEFPDYTPTGNQQVIEVVNKTDTFQALSGIGLEWLESELYARTASYHKSMDDKDSVLVTNLRHKEALDQSLQDIDRTIEALAGDIPADLVVEDLRQCLMHLASITGGEITPDEVLGNIFKNFCIGK